MNAPDEPLAPGGSDEPGIPASLDEWASVEFEPWPIGHYKGLMKELANPRYQSDMDRIGVDLRIAAATLKESKAHLVQGYTKLGQKIVFELMDSLDDTVKRLRQLADYGQKASTRMMIAAACAALASTEEPPKRPKRRTGRK
jgi:hypothetical protein